MSGGARRPHRRGRMAERPEARAASLAELLSLESAKLLELYRKRENLSGDVLAGAGRLVSVPPPSAQLGAADKLRRLHAALLQCRSLTEGAVAKEDDEMGGGTGEYETLRKTVKERLSSLVNTVGELVKAAGGPTPALTPPASGRGSEPSPSANPPTNRNGDSVFLYRDFWSQCGSVKS
ncbi:ciliary neurotrophic factor isoform X2 [Syngnathoides biaculeatus]|uniref:ciliary neurotrophic factor isoform X2 n=1 Tax=Syngnathoides biaculeatus TaxID=300417 RepID=UPI002ADDA721|nr:ciliary neurotrophic factor isoform X2 [Syngnathoides biaculeatus]